MGEAVDDLEEEADREAGRLLLDRVEAGRKPQLATLHEALDSRRYLDLTQALVDPAVTPPPLDGADRPAREAYPELASRSWEHLRGESAGWESARRTPSCTGSASSPSGPATRRGRVRGHPGRRAPRRGHRRPAGRARRPPGCRRGAAMAAGLDAADATAPEAFVAGLLVRDEEKLARTHRRQWRDAWEKADRKKLKAWLTP